MNIAVDFNNCGIKFLEMRGFADAAIMFRGALQVLLHVCQGDRLSSNDEHIQSAARKLFRFNSDESYYTTRLNKVLQSEDTRLCFVYNKAMKFGTAEKSNLSSCVLLFNTALTIHLQTLQNQCFNKIELERAYGCYLMVYEILVTEENPLDDMSIRLALAVLNNLGQIQHELGDYELSGKYLHEIERLVQIDYRDIFLDANGFRDDEEKFLLNALLLRQPEYAAAA